MLYVFGEWTLDTQRYVLSRSGCIVPLRRKAFQVLTYLLTHPDRVISKQELCEQIWPQQFISDATLESTIKAVRQAIGDSGRGQRLLQTIYGAGYRLIVPVQARPVPSPADEGMALLPEPPAAPPRPSTAGEDSAPAPLELADLPDESALQNATPVSLPGAPDAERRQLTVLVCALMAEPALASPLAPDDLYAVLHTYQETCARIIRQCDGHIAQYRGEELIVYFGYPQAHDDDARRAVRVGLRLVDTFGKQPSRLTREHGIRLAVRVGVHTGLVLVGSLGDGGPHDRWALGDTPTLAAQMQACAAPDTVVISGATQQLVQGYFTCHPLDLQPGHGRATSLQTYRVVQECGTYHRLDIVTATGLTPFVGREHEVGLLMACWEQATEGLGRIAVIQGEAGIGKSRLVQVLQEHLAAEPHTEMVWRASPSDQQSALHPVLTHLQRLVRVHPEDTPATILQRLEEVLASSGLPLPEVVPLFATLLALPLPSCYPPLLVTPQRQRHQTLEALLAWLLAEATRQPLLCIVEDLHWLDPSTLEFLSMLVDQAPTARLLLVLTCRPEFHPPWGFRAHLTPITLGRLSPSQAALLVQRVAGKALPPAVQEHLVTHTDGVPLFIEEVTKLVLESGQLQVYVDYDALTGPLPALAIPATLHDALMARLDRLASFKAVAQLGAVMGRTFAYEVLQAVAPWDEMTLQYGLRQLVEAELVYQRGVPPQATYRFKHALIQETAYQSLLTNTRRQYHQQIAQVVETRFAETVAAQPELLAQHYTAAGCPAQAIPYWQRAGRQALQRSAHLEAIQHLTQGLALVATLPETVARVQQELDLQLALGPALMATKGPVLEVEQLYARARALCQQVGETPQLFPTLQGLYWFYETRGVLEMARELGEQLVRQAQRTAGPTLRLEAHAALGTALFFIGDYTTAWMHLEQGLSVADPAMQQTLALRSGLAPGVRCLALAANTLWCLGSPVQAIRRSQEALALAQELVHPHSLAFAHNWAAFLYHRLREVSAVQAQAEALLTLATAQGFSLHAGSGTCWRGWVLVVQGQGDAGLAHLRQGLEAILATGQMLGRSLRLVQFAEAAGHAGQVEEGLRLVAEALVAIEASGRGELLAEAHRLQGALLLQRAVPEAIKAEACFQQALTVARRQQAKSWELRTATSLARLWQQQGKRQEAYDLLAPIYHWFTEGFDTADLQDARALLDALA